MPSEWISVRSVLGSPKWDFRTVDGIAKETSLDPRQVEELIEQHRSEIRQTMSRDRQIVYTLKSRPLKVREVIAEIQRFASKSF